IRDKLGTKRGATTRAGPRRFREVFGPGILSVAGRLVSAPRVIPTMTTTSHARSADSLGVLGLPMPVKEMTARPWDVILVGAGHNGLTCAASLARAGRRVLVLEARKRVGGACTLEELWPGYRVSPCAYLVGLLHPLVIEELGLVGRGLTWVPASAGMFVPF